jgi:hypothetical protein
VKCNSQIGYFIQFGVFLTPRVTVGPNYQIIVISQSDRPKISKIYTMILNILFIMCQNFMAIGVRKTSAKNTGFAFNEQ